MPMPPSPPMRGSNTKDKIVLNHKYTSILAKDYPSTSMPTFKKGTQLNGLYQSVQYRPVGYGAVKAVMTHVLSVQKVVGGVNSKGIMVYDIPLDYFENRFWENNIE
jgi:hypothetical protein